MQNEPEQWADKVLDDVITVWSEYGHSAALDTIQAAFAERESRLVGALEQIATVDMGGGFLGAQACRKVALAALKDRTHD